MLAGGIGTIAGKVTATELANSGILTPNATAFLTTQNSYTTTKPKAFLNWILLDEQFHYVSASSGFEQVGTDGELKTHAFSNLSIEKNGYLYVYVSNETPNIDVFFDNLQVSHVRGPLLEETHYYPFGLAMQGISTRAAGAIENKKEKFQGQEFTTDLGLDYYEFKYRTHDPQIGRFLQIDPLAEDYRYNSTYAFSENKVTSHIELEGLEALSVQDLWRSAGITSSTDPKQYVKDVGKETTKPSTWFAAAAAVGQIGGGVVLTSLLTEGLFSGTIATAEVSTLRSTATTTATTEAGEVSLATRANEIHSTLPLKTQDFNTTAVGSATTSEGNSVRLVASNEKNLRGVQINALKSGEIAVSGERKAHAEIRILDHAAANGMTVNAVAASRPICAGCATAINNAGAVPASPLKVYPTPKAVADATFVKPAVIIFPKQ